ncbi:GNAT family N-acetyltransferase [Algibacter aquimarinus]|uniref:BioF2-like acetyltransferase domain-containing protein n=1 Tax=Algibacter aquimarinus TaxID=1136748 RepID=A0ABP9HCW3_9FLAO
MIHYKIYRNTSEIPKAWDELPIQDVFLKLDFLKGLEASFPSNISSYYLSVFKDENLVGIAIIQRVKMYAEDIFRNNGANTLKQFAKQVVSKIVKGNALVVGNLMHTGQHGVYFKNEAIAQNDYLSQLENAIDDLILEIKTKFNKKVRIVVFKDYFENDTIHENTSFFKANNLFKIQLQPNMVFEVADRWKSENDYVLDFNKKYRRRYRTARKKAANLNYRELDTDYLKQNSDTIFKLYETVSDNASVNSFKLKKDHFYQLKSHLKENFKVFGVFLNESLVGFYTLILNNKTLETYFLGYNKELQHQHQMYLNMLFNMAAFGINNGFKTIVYARTAMEIKSSIGAKPQTMHVYLNHTNSFVANTVLRCIVKYMNPIQKWEERHPF